MRFLAFFIDLVTKRPQFAEQVGSVPHSESGVAPMSSLLGVGQLGSGKLERVE
jgi:hypothetical protein